MRSTASGSSPKQSGSAMSCAAMAADVPREASRAMNRKRSFLPPDVVAAWILPVALIVGWEIAADSGLIAARVLPAPSAVARAFWQTWRDGSLAANVGVSSLRALEGLLIGGSLGFALGIANGLWRPAEIALDSSLQMLRNIPHLAIIPLVILWFGIGEEAKIFLVSIGVLFPIYINTYHGVRAILPGALPSIFVGLRYGLGIMWLTLIVAETISASSGIGYMTMNAREFLQTDVVLLGIIIYGLLGKLSDVATKFLERAALAWHPSYSRPTEAQA